MPRCPPAPQATSFGSSPWPALGPLLTSLPQPLYNALPVGLAPLISNPFRVALKWVGGAAGAGAHRCCWLNSTGRLGQRARQRPQ